MTIATTGGTTTLGLYDTQSQLKEKADITYVDNRVDPLQAGHKGYATLAQAQAAQSGLTPNTVVEVLSDTTEANNGYYLWNGTTLTKTTFNPLVQANNYTDSKVATAKAETIVIAASDATTKANSAISTAASDATNKANNAVTVANNYTDSRYNSLVLETSQFATQAEAAATAANIAGKVYATAAEGVAPVTGVPSGQYFNVRSSSNDNYIDEYLNNSGVAQATGKSYPSSNYLINLPHNNLKNRDASNSHPSSAISYDSNTLEFFLNTQKQINTAQKNKNLESTSVKDFGAIGDGTLHTLQEWVNSGKFSNLIAIQVVYPHATALTDSIDWVACQGAIDYVGKGGSVLFNQTAVNSYIIDRPLKFYNGQKWTGTGGVDVIGLGTEIKLSANATSVAEPKTPTATTYGFNPIGIYFNAQSFGDVGLSLYNTSYANVDQCAANSGKVGGCGILLDSDVSKQCYFNKINQPRVFAGGAGGTGIRFTRGANANQVFGGKCGSSQSGMEFLSLSAGNLIIGTDFEDNAVKHVFLDAPGNVFIATHMETAPIGYDITANGSETRRIATTFAATVTTYVQDNSGGITQTVVHESYPSGLAELITGASKQTTQYFTTSVTQNNDFKLLVGTENLVINFFRNTNSSSASKRITFFKGDGTATESFRFDIATAEFQCGDIIQKSSTNIQRKMIRGAAIPTTGTWSTGDKVLRTNNSATAVVTEWACIAAGTPGTWQATAWIVNKGTTAQRPILTSNDSGVQYFDTTLAANGKPIWWNGTAWVDALGVVV